MNLNGHNSLTLSGGNYYASNFDISGNAQVNVTGQVTLYVNGNFGIGGSADINVLNNLPKNFRIRMVCSAGINLGGNSDLYADIYGPQSPVNISGNGDIYGAIISGGISMSGGGNVHYDESLGYGQSGSGGSSGSGTSSGSGQISLVK